MKEKIFYGILAGVFISMAAVAYLVSANAVVGSVLFAFGLLTIVNYNFQLFTGVVGYISTQEKAKDYLTYSLFVLGVWFWNLAGSLIVGLLVSNTRTYKVIYPKLEALMQTKCNDSFSSLLILGIFCGILMFIAVNTYKRTEAPPVAKVVLLFACVVVFILSGYEHCVANMGYIALYQKFNCETLRVLLVTSLGNIIGCNLIPLCLRLAKR
ncbi:MAG: formate/nitrite transporter family protein [Lentisphaeria bacterium]|nr:formate/nitrite transporter family protein [Lentisphaeria bacterium]